MTERKRHTTPWQTEGNITKQMRTMLHYRLANQSNAWLQQIIEHCKKWFMKYCIHDTKNTPSNKHFMKHLINHTCIPHVKRMQKISQDIIKCTITPIIKKQMHPASFRMHHRPYAVTHMTSETFHPTSSIPIIWHHTITMLKIEITYISYHIVRIAYYTKYFTLYLEKASQQTPQIVSPDEKFIMIPSKLLRLWVFKLMGRTTSPQKVVDLQNIVLWI